MSAHEIHALSGAYAVDALEPDERAEFERHLAGCSVCQAEVASLREATALLAVDAETDPPAALRDRVLAGISTVRPLPPAAPVRARRLGRARRLPTLLAAAAVLVVAGLGTTIWLQNTSNDSTRPTAAELILGASDAKRVEVELPGGASATVVRSVSERRAVLVTHDMPPAPAGKVYELWLQTPAGTMQPAGLMDGAGSTTVVLDGDAAKATGVGITVEPPGGSAAPTTDPVALFDFAQAT